MDQIITGIPRDQLIMATAGFAFGWLQKHYFTGDAWYRPKIANNVIPFANTIIGAIVGQAIGVGAAAGGIAGAASVGGHQMGKIAAKKIMLPTGGK